MRATAVVIIAVLILALLWLGLHKLQNNAIKIDRLEARIAELHKQIETLQSPATTDHQATLVSQKVTAQLSPLLFRAVATQGDDPTVRFQKLADEHGWSEHVRQQVISIVRESHQLAQQGPNPQVTLKGIDMSAMQAHRKRSYDEGFRRLESLIGKEPARKAARLVTVILQDQNNSEPKAAMPQQEL